MTTPVDRVERDRGGCDGGEADCGECGGGGVGRGMVDRGLAEEPGTLGRRAGGFFEVRSGLDEGARLAVSGAFTLKSALRSGELSEGHEH